jgi:hypothetical protein
MFAVILSLWREWKAHTLLKATIVSSVGLCVAGGFLGVHPLAVAECLAVFSLCLGWKAGCSFKADTPARDLYASARLRTLHGAVGTLCGVLVVALAHIALIAPCLSLMAIVWGIPAASLALCLAICLASCILASALGCLFSLASSSDDAFIGALCIAFWLVTTGIAPALRVANPFLQIWLSVTGRGRETAWLCAPILLAASAAFYAIVVLALHCTQKGGSRK